MAFRDLTDVLGVTPPKTLPICGVLVEFPATISARSGQMLLAVAASARSSADATPDEVASRLHLTDEDGERLEAELLGDGAQALDDLGVIGDRRQHVVQTLIAWHLRGQEAAEAVWHGAGKATAPKDSKPRGGRASKTVGGARGRSKAGAGASSAPRKVAAATSRRGSRSAGTA